MEKQDHKQGRGELYCSNTDSCPVYNIFLEYASKHLEKISGKMPWGNPLYESIIKKDMDEGTYFCLAREIMKDKVPDWSNDLGECEKIYKLNKLEEILEKLNKK